MTSPKNIGDLEAQLLNLDGKNPNCKKKILEFRREMDSACDRGDITLKEWRALVEKVSVIQEQCVSREPDGWRHPPISGRSV